MIQSLVGRGAMRTLLLCMIATCYASCSKTDTKPVIKNPSANISSINVNSGPYNTVVIITGTGFDTIRANNKVFFNGKLATVSAATTTQLTVTVPLGAGTGNITLSVDNAAAVTGPVFNYQISTIVSILAGGGTQGSTNGQGNSASFNYPTGIAVDTAGNAYVADWGNNLIRKISKTGNVTTLAGSGSAGSVNGLGTSASFYAPYGVGLDASGNVYVADYFNNSIRKINTSGMVTTLAGSGSSGAADGTGASASFRGPSAVAADAMGNVYVADLHNHLIRKINAAGVVTTFAGSGSPGSTNGTGTAASFNYPSGVAVDAAGNVYVADSGNNLIRKINAAGVVSTFAGSGSAGSADGTGSSASFNNPASVAVDAAGNVYVADYLNNLIRKIGTAGVVTTISAKIGSTGNPFSFNSPIAIASDAVGKLYIVNYANSLIYKISFE